MPPEGPVEHPGCNCRAVKPCFENIQNMLSAAKKLERGIETDEGVAKKERERDMRDPDSELDMVPTVDCSPPRQAPKYPCSLDIAPNEDAVQIERKLLADAARGSCPCDACLHGAMFDDCGNPYIDIERKYVEAIRSGHEPSKDFFPDEAPAHECREHRDRERDRAPGDPDSDFEHKTCGNCPCCLAFRPHPPVTIATPDLYRTCGLPKRFKYPAWFHGYGNNNQHPMYRTTSSDFGKFPPTVHTVPTVYHPIDRSWSNLFTKIGPYRDTTLRTTGSIWDAYTYYDFP